MTTPETKHALDMIEQMDKRTPPNSEARDSQYTYKNELLMRAILAEIVGLREDLAKARANA